MTRRPNWQKDYVDIIFTDFDVRDPSQEEEYLEQLRTVIDSITA